MVSFDRAIDNVHACIVSVLAYCASFFIGIAHLSRRIKQSAYTAITCMCYLYEFSFREKTRRLRCSNTIFGSFSLISCCENLFILPVWAGSLSPDSRWGCICKGGGPALLDHYSLPSCAHAHCWTWKMLSGSRLLSQSLRMMLSLTVSFFSPTRTPHLEEAHKIKIREIKSEMGGPMHM